MEDMKAENSQAAPREISVLWARMRFIVWSRVKRWFREWLERERAKDDAIEEDARWW